MHPENERIYKYLGGCLQDYEMTDLDDIRARQE